jgi:hypothetical protein
MIMAETDISEIFVLERSEKPLETNQKALQNPEENVSPDASESTEEAKLSRAL